MFRALNTIRYIHSAFILVVFFFTFSWTHAQMSLADGEVHLTLNPTSPVPDSRIDASIYSSTIDFDTALITWTLNGKTVLHGYSEDGYTFTVDDLGATYTLSVKILADSGVTYHASKSFTVSDVDFVWEGRTYTPPFYKGRALQTSGSEVVVSALPSVTKSNGSLYDKEELVYIWTLDEANKTISSGKGKHTVVFQNTNPFSNANIYLEVKDPSGVTRVSREVQVPMSTPILALYPETAYASIEYATALKNIYNMPEDKSSFLAEPYFFTGTSRFDPAFEYVWNVGGNKHTFPGSISFGNEVGQSGSTPLVLEVSNTNHWLQNARFDTTIRFGTQSIWRTTNPETLAL